MSLWTEYVKRFAQINDISYGCALSMPECRQGYQVYKERLARQQRQPARQPKSTPVQPVRTSLKERMKEKIGTVKPVEKIDELDLLRRLKLEEEEKQRDRLDREQMKQEAFKKDKKETVRKTTKQEEQALEEYLKSLDKESKSETKPKIKRKNF